MRVSFLRTCPLSVISVEDRVALSIAAQDIGDFYGFSAVKHLLSFEETRLKYGPNSASVGLSAHHFSRTRFQDLH